jgi:hypothetical protein
MDIDLYVPISYIVCVDESGRSIRVPLRHTIILQQAYIGSMMQGKLSLEAFLMNLQRYDVRDQADEKSPDILIKENVSGIREHLLRHGVIL